MQSRNAKLWGGVSTRPKWGGRCWAPLVHQPRRGADWQSAYVGLPPVDADIPSAPWVGRALSPTWRGAVGIPNHRTRQLRMQRGAARKDNARGGQELTGFLSHGAVVDLHNRRADRHNLATHVSRSMHAHLNRKRVHGAIRSRNCVGRTALSTGLDAGSQGGECHGTEKESLGRLGGGAGLVCV
jgi:hypothetical protein